MRRYLYEGPCGHGPVSVQMVEDDSPSNAVIKVVQRNHPYYKHGEELFVPKAMLTEVDKSTAKEHEH